METKSPNPTFTVSLRGYDRVQVDEYLDSLSEALGRVHEAEEHTRHLQAHIASLNAKIKHLEARPGPEPRASIAISERVGELLRTAEQAAEETVTDAKEAAEVMIAEAERKLGEADDTVARAASKAGEEARRIESNARTRAAEILAEADKRATARHRQIEQWAEQVISHTRAEEARMLSEHRARREAFDAEAAGMEARRHAAYTDLAKLKDAVEAAMTLCQPSGAAGPPERDERRDTTTVTLPFGSTDTDVTGDESTALHDMVRELSAVDRSEQTDEVLDDALDEDGVEEWVSSRAAFDHDQDGQ